MAQHKGAERRERLSQKRKIANKGQKVALRKMVKALDASETKAPEAVKSLQSRLDKLAAKGLVHKNFAANKKSKLAKSLKKTAAA